jgi:uncharacterized membrane protein YdfJ with MMPL/SSD domain
MSSAAAASIKSGGATVALTVIAAAAAAVTVVAALMVLAGSAASGPANDTAAGIIATRWDMMHDLTRLRTGALGRVRGHVIKKNYIMEHFRLTC